MRKNLFFMLLILFCSLGVQAQNNAFVEKAAIVMLDGKYKGADVRTTITLSKSGNKGANITVDFKGKPVEDIVSCIWIDSNKKIWPLYNGNVICLLDANGGISIVYEKDTNKLLLNCSSVSDGEIDVSRVAFSESKKTMKFLIERDKEKAFDYLKLFFKRAE